MRYPARSSPPSRAGTPRRQSTCLLYTSHGVESAALDDVFELLAWNQGIGFFSSEIGPSALFQAYKLIKNGEKQGKPREEICACLLYTSRIRFLLCFQKYFLFAHAVRAVSFHNEPP